jgi:uncharacterized protein YndB with AHSA1/START domain
MTRHNYAAFAAAVFLLFSVSLIPISAASLEPVATEGIVNAPADAVWKAFTVSSVIEQWMVAKTEIDLKVGGTWRTSYSKDSNLNDDMAIHHTILAFDPGRMLAFRTIKIPKNFPYPEVTGTWTVVYFESAGTGKTRVTARMFGFEDDDQGRRMRAFFERGNQSEFDALVKFFETGVPQTVR